MSEASLQRLWRCKCPPYGIPTNPEVNQDPSILSLNIGAELITYTILGAPSYNYGRIFPKPLF